MVGNNPTIMRLATAPAYTGYLLVRMILGKYLYDLSRSAIKVPYI
jgi:hypothetical protein